MVLIVTVQEPAIAETASKLGEGARLVGLAGAGSVVDVAAVIVVVAAPDDSVVAFEGAVEAVDVDAAAAVPATVEYSEPPHRIAGDAIDAEELEEGHQWEV